ncbi:MAG: hypothetical protein PHV34_24880 [Verrucomicrobiae bacterium]|nr:hypothetical protein [Verrucomicrobiae bacterium]
MNKRNMTGCFGLAILLGLMLQGWAGGVEADSEREFSDQQGRDNWCYGCYRTPTGGFEKMEYFGTSRSSTWCYSKSGDETDCWLSDRGGHSTLAEDGTLLWAARRWLSEVNGQISISGRIAKDSVMGGDGFFGRIFVDGREVYSRFISSTDVRGVDYSVKVKVKKNSRVDFVIDFNKSADRDDAVFTASIVKAD